MRQKIIDLLRKIAPSGAEIKINVPEEERFGHYSTNLAFLLAKIEKRPPLAIAEKIREKLLTAKTDLFEKIEVAPPGFVNFFLNKEYLQKSLLEILKKKGNYGKDKKNKEKISLDYLDANPTGPVHLGHARSGFFGDVLSNILEFSGRKVSREFYVNNAKASAQIQSLGRTVLGQGTEYQHDQLRKILKKPDVKGTLKKMKSEIEAGYYIAKIIQKENKRFLEKVAKIHFDLFFEEESVYQKGLIKKILTTLQKKGVIYKKDGAIWFRASRYGDNEDRVIVKKDGTPTYVLPDAVYHLDRLVRRKYDIAVDIFGADHYGYGPRLIGIIEALGIKRNRIKFLTAQAVRLIRNGREFKMSKRKGIFVTLEELIKEVGLDAARFFFISSSLDTQFLFDISLAKERSMKNPVYYIQYAYVRAINIIKKIKIQNLKTKNTDQNLKLLNTPDDLNLIRKLIQFPEIVEDIVGDYQIHRLTRYAIELAREFHNFYEKEKIIGAEPAVAAARLILVWAAVIVLENLFSLLGVSKPKKM